jgi:hypothetical protein
MNELRAHAPEPDPLAESPRWHRRKQTPAVHSPSSRKSGTFVDLPKLIAEAKKDLEIAEKKGLVNCQRFDPEKP